MAIDNNEMIKKIDYLLKQRGWTKYKLAKEASIPYSSISNMYSRNTLPSLYTLEKICNAFDIGLSEFFSTSSDNEEAITYVLSDDEKKLLDSYRALNSTKKALLQSYAMGLNSQDFLYNL